MKVLLIITNVDWFLISHRLVIAKEAVKNGWKVYVAAEDTGRGNEINVDGIEFIDFKFSRSGTNPISEIRTVLKFKNLYQKLKPNVVHQITLKPVIYGSFAAKLVGIKGVLNAISGMGYMFTAGRIGLLQRIILKLMKIGFNRNNLGIIFQNEDDKLLLESLGVINEKNKLYKIKGSGVSLVDFSHSAIPNFNKINILLPCRMLWDKGVKELRDATDLLKDKYKDKITFNLVGMADDDNHSGVTSDYLNEWQDGKFVKWHGHQSNMIQFYKDSHIVVLPSYREGLPKSLIEACAIGRAIVTTDAVGCKDCVDEGVNGFKVPIGDSQKLAAALVTLIEDNDLIINMGLESRKKAEREFDVNEVINKHLDIYNSLLL